MNLQLRREIGSPRVTSSKWSVFWSLYFCFWFVFWLFGFFLKLPFHQRIPIFTIMHGWKNLFGRPGDQQRSTSTPLEEKKNLSGHIGEGKTTAFIYPHHPSPWAAQLSAKRALVSPWFPEGKVRAHEWVPRFPSCIRCWQRGPFFSHSIQRMQFWDFTYFSFENVFSSRYLLPNTDIQ